MDLSLKIDVVENIDTEKFQREYLIPQKPVLIKGLAERTFAGRHWSIQYFKKTSGDIMVDVFDNTNKKNDSSAFTKPDKQMKFSDYLELISWNTKTDLRIFLFDLFRIRPELRQQFPCPDIFRGILGSLGYVFFGGKDTTVRMHQDIDMSNVLLTQFEGRKRVVLFSPDYSDFLYKLPLNTYTLINPDKPDYEKFPALKYVKGYEFVMEAGDSLFMPSGYWHYMTYLEGGFAVSYRKIAQSFSLQINGLLNLALFLPLDKLMNFILKDRWMRYKTKTAYARASIAVERLAWRQPQMVTMEQGVTA